MAAVHFQRRVGQHRGQGTQDAVPKAFVLAHPLTALPGDLVPNPPRCAFPAPMEAEIAVESLLDRVAVLGLAAG
jgi:hypothetical protein